MNRFDITQTNVAVERLIETTENPRHLYLLHAYNRHRYLEMAGRFEEIFTPEMMVERPVYRFNILDTTTTLNGAEAVKEVYREWTRTAQCIFYTGGDEKLAVSDVMIVRASVWLVARSMMSRTDICLYLRRISRTRSKITTVSLSE